MKLKVCGLTTLEQLQQLQELNIDYAGLIFYDGSKRYAHEKLELHQTEIQKLQLKKVGVFVNADMGFLKSLILFYRLSAVQLHGNETPELCDELQQSTKVIKVFRISDATKNIDGLIQPFQPVCDFFLFDTDTTGYGGSGKRFDWSVLQKASINKPFFLSGGIGPDDMGILQRFSHPFLHAIDINSRFETGPGIKNMNAVKTFVHALKQPMYE